MPELAQLFYLTFSPSGSSLMRGFFAGNPLAKSLVGQVGMARGSERHDPEARLIQAAERHATSAASIAAPWPSDRAIGA